MAATFPGGRPRRRPSARSLGLASPIRGQPSHRRAWIWILPCLLFGAGAGLAVLEAGRGAHASATDAAPTVPGPRTLEVPVPIIPTVVPAPAREPAAEAPRAPAPARAPDPARASEADALIDALLQKIRAENEQRRRERDEARARARARAQD